METKRKLIHISHKIRALTKFSPRIHHLIFLLDIQEKENESFSKPFKPFGNYIFSQCIFDSKVQTISWKTMWREWKISMWSETLSTWIEGEVFSKFWVSPLFCSSEQFFEEFFSQHHLPFLQSLTFFLHSLFAFCLEELMMINFLLFSSLMWFVRKFAMGIDP